MWAAMGGVLVFRGWVGRWRVGVSAGRAGWGVSAGGGLIYSVIEVAVETEYHCFASSGFYIFFPFID